MNKVILSGRVTRDVDLRYTPSQMAVARFSLALDRGKDKDGNDKGADFPNCVAFGRTAETLDKWVGKGGRISIDGHLQTGSYEKDGHKVYTTDVIVDRLEIIDFKSSEGAQTSSTVLEGFSALDDADLPF